ncbi:hypothetical protein EZS27_012954 [termite gut metagenome]|uniref:Uncharacterized protein n=1 Tax=termite gut metagenome TaxID=433724 RepID=A0A5J4S1C3_9ZZZZ
MIMSTDKMDSSNVYEMFEEIKEIGTYIKDKLMKTPSAPTQEPIDVTAVNALTEQLETVIEEVRKPTKHEHRHIIEIGSSKAFLSMIVMVIAIFGLSFAIGNQRETISQYQNNDLKYRYIKMQGKTSKENLYRLERQFWYRDSVTIVRKQVEKYELLVKEQAERIERARLNADAAGKLQREVDELKGK